MSDDFLYRPKQELDKIGPIYSSKDEIQRTLANDIRDLKIKKPNVSVNIPMDIPGLDRKPVFGGRNAATLRMFAPWRTFGRGGGSYITHHYNVSRIVVPAFIFAYYIYDIEHFTRGTWYDKELNNMETETAYIKMQTFTVHYAEHQTLMA